MTMKNQAIFLFLILLVGLLLSSFLGSAREGFEVSTYTGVNGGSGATATGSQGNTAGIYVGPQGNVYTGSSSDVQNKYSNNSYDNYNHHTGTSYPTMYYGPNGGTAKLVHSNGIYSVIVTDGNGNVNTYSLNTNNDTRTNSHINTNTHTGNSTTTGAYGSDTTYYGPNGGQASIIKANNGDKAIKIIEPSGKEMIFYSQNPQTYNPSYDNVNTSTTYSSGTNYDSAYATGPNGGSAGYVQGPNGGSAGYVQAPATATSNANPYYSSMPRGIPASQIPPGQEDLYILKSEIVPPVCPACPTAGSCPRQEPCPACPPCGRCPEPPITCKAVPNYNAISSEYLPQPILNSFSTFGM